MGRLMIAASGFRGQLSPLNRHHRRTISAKKCIKFATTVGNSHFSRAFGRTVTALSLSVYRAMAIVCAIDFGHTSLQIRPEYSQLESTEKMNLSYWVGMTFTAISADALLDVPRLIHAQQHGGIRRANKKSRSLADLVGMDRQSNWHVFEAKGRQKPPTTQESRDWKTQARTVASINGSPVSTRNYCVCLLKNPISVNLVDPPRKGKANHFSVDLSEIREGYYSPFVQFLKTNSVRVKRDGRTFTIRPIAYDPIDDAHIYVGLDDYYLQMSQNDTFDPPHVAEYEDDTFYTGSDGVAIATSSTPCEYLL